MSVEYEGLKKTLGGSETAKEIDETEKRLKVWYMAWLGIYSLIEVLYSLLKCFFGAWLWCWKVVFCLLL